MEFIGLSSKKHSFMSKFFRSSHLFAFGFAVLAGSVQAQPLCTASIVNQWWGGSQVNLTVSNPTSSVFTDWHVEITYSEGQVAHSWGADMSGSSPASFSAPVWASNLAPQGSYSFGFIALYNSSFEQPQITACYDGSQDSFDDADEDGVEDGVDLCAATELGAGVDESGCSLTQLDSDSDSINDALDTCPSTMVGHSVDENGCAVYQLDTDNDDVHDGVDDCPATPVGEAVNLVGCSQNQRDQQDSDGDGVINGLDTCPSTMVGQNVDGNGCAVYQLDTDNDGVHDGVDDCPATPVGEAVNLVGCSQNQRDQQDSDGDGVINGLDACPSTMVGQNVDGNGCAVYQLDTDSDGVHDGVDDCPATPVGEGVNLIGCSLSQLDADSDGVNDILDSCAATPVGETVDAVGCSQSQIDTDSDGVFNNADTCAATPVGESVDAVGCSQSQIDTDSDGVFNNADTCSLTPEGEAVNSNGCSQSQIDSDEDGVFNNADTCAATPVGESVDAVGCSQSQIDTDSDGVFNNADTCSLTPEGEAVNSNGCSQSQIDSDEDGVFNNTDTCVATPAGETVDAVGCSQSQIDTDSDGVFNNADTCSLTPEGEAVNSNGCSQSQIDSDEDGVFNNADTCAATPVGESVDAVGCSQSQIDDDSDGVENQFDLCPSTTDGSDVDSNGCALDQLDDDSDGVSNILDKCLLSPSEVTVTEYGCDVAGDEDGDFIINEKDYCPFVVGVMELRGCKPNHIDFDGDGINDIEDQCPWTIHPDALLPADLQLLLIHPVDATGCGPSDFFDSGLAMQVVNGNDRCAYSLDDPFFNPTSINIDGCIDDEVADSDGDGVINGLDSCPNLFGKAALNGCTDDLGFDWDNDGVPNEQDHCPHSASNGDVGANGCMRVGPDGNDHEDLDQDGVENWEDLCAQSPYGHPVDFKGCTLLQEHHREDGDQDGIINKWDACPDDPASEQGTSALGCPLGDFFLGSDFDFDGLPNSIDLCPNDSGLFLHEGCPTRFTHNFSTGIEELSAQIDDRDLDGVPDFFDRCPLTHIKKDSSKYIASEQQDSLLFEGCSNFDMRDDDSDGVRNGNDFCPRTQRHEFIDERGCNDFERIDSDGDGLINGADLCPLHLGLWKLNGCAENINDADQDGVQNEMDQCPASSSFAGSVDPITGCAQSEFQDNDGDDVENNQDNCPNTEFMAFVIGDGFADNERGCSFLDLTPLEDEDGDSVLDQFDMCLGTVSGESVDINGCPDPFGDGDGDNVPNEFDQCQHTPKGVAIDDDGCVVVSSTILASTIRLFHVSDQSIPPVIEIDLKDFLSNQESNDLSTFSWVEVGPINIGAQMQSQFVSSETHRPLVSMGDLFIDHFGDQRLIVDVAPPLREQTIRIPIRIHANASSSSNWSEIIIRPIGSGLGSADLGSLIVTDAAILNNTGIRLIDVFDRLVQGSEFDASHLYRQFWDSQRTSSFFGSNFICTGEFNGFPIVCDRPETTVAQLGPGGAFAEMDGFALTAVVNRADLRIGDWQDCGEHRMVFADRDGPGRLFLNFEARLPNPTPGNIQGCEPVLRFWEELASLPIPEKGLSIRQFFIDGVVMPAVLTPDHFTLEGGQIRSNQFQGGDWLLKEHKLTQGCANQGCGTFSETVSVKSNPFGELFNPSLPFSSSANAETAANFQDDFIQRLDDLSGSEFGSLALNTPDVFNHGQSFASGPAMRENDFRFHFFQGSGFSFTDDLFISLQGRFNADGSPLNEDQVLARATALTCAGCHNPREFGLDQPGSIGTLNMPDGSTINRWPDSLDFVHIDEFGNMSPALRDVFLPVRAADFSQVISEL